MTNVIWEDHGQTDAEFISYVEETLLPSLKEDAPNTAEDVARLLFLAKRSVRKTDEIASRTNTILRHDANIRMSGGYFVARVKNHEKNFDTELQAKEWMYQFAKELAEREVHINEVMP